MDVLPSPKGSHAIPMRGAKLALDDGPTAPPQGEFCPPMAMPLRYGLGAVPATMLPVVVLICGAFELLKSDGTKLVSSEFESSGWPKNE